MDHTHYYHAPDLARFGEVGKGAPELWEKFQAWYGAVFAEGALTAREKALIALAVESRRAVSVLHRCLHHGRRWSRAPTRSR